MYDEMKHPLSSEFWYLYNKTLSLLRLIIIFSLFSNPDKKTPTAYAVGVLIC